MLLAIANNSIEYVDYRWYWLSVVLLEAQTNFRFLWHIVFRVFIVKLSNYYSAITNFKKINNVHLFLFAESSLRVKCLSNLISVYQTIKNYYKHTHTFYFTNLLIFLGIYTAFSEKIFVIKKCCHSYWSLVVEDKFSVHIKWKTMTVRGLSCWSHAEIL